MNETMSILESILIKVDVGYRKLEFGESHLYSNVVTLQNM